MGKSCCLIGSVFIDDVKSLRLKVIFTVEYLIKEGFSHFYVGNFGLFHSLAASVCSELSKKYSINITFICSNEKSVKEVKNDVKDFFNIENVTTFADKDSKDIDTVSYNIQKMIDWSDCVILYEGYVDKFTTDAYKYAKDNNKRIINI